jgi:hypothetical protein
MAINANLLPRLADRRLFLTAAIGFPLLVLIGYFKSYYFSAFFDVRPVANSLVHAHGIVMSLWVIYFVVQVALIRSKNIKLHMSMGMAGIALAALVVIVGMATAYDSQLVRLSAPPGLEPYKFFIIPLVDMFLFVIFFTGAIYYRKRPAEHKTLMLMTAINFLPPAFARMPFIPEQGFILWLFGISAAIAFLCLIWFTAKHRKLNKVFALSVLLFVASLPLRLIFAETTVWHNFTNWLAP